MEAHGQLPTVPIPKSGPVQRAHSSCDQMKTNNLLDGKGRGLEKPAPFMQKIYFFSYKTIFEQNYGYNVGQGAQSPGKALSICLSAQLRSNVPTELKRYASTPSLSLSKPTLKRDMVTV